MCHSPAVRRVRRLLLIAVLFGRAGDVRADDEAPAQSPTADERQAAAALDAIGATLRINGQFQLVSVSLLNGDAVTNDILAHIGRLKDLQTLSVTGLKITDEALQQFSGLKRLTTLTLRDVAATDEGIARLQAALPDCRIRRSTSATGIRGAPNGFAAADAARVAADRQAALAAARERFGVGRAPVPADPFGPPSPYYARFALNFLMRELLKTDAQIEIELTAQQWDALQSLQADGAAATGEIGQRIRDLGQQSTVEEQNRLREQLRTELEQLQVAAEERIKALLSAEQFQRLQQLAWHTRGPLMLLDPAFTEDLGLNDAQQARIDAVRDAERRVIEQLADPDLRSSTSRARGLPTSQWSDQLLAVLTDEQRAAFRQKLGPPPETDVERIGQHVFALLDTNGNEELSEDEWGSADTGRLLSLPRSRVRTTLPLGRAEFVRLFVSLREQPHGRAAPGF